MNKKPKAFKPTPGGEGLILSTILRAQMDLSSSRRKIRESALAYFAGPVYQSHLDWLGLPDDFLPEGAEEVIMRYATKTQQMWSLIHQRILIEMDENRLSYPQAVSKLAAERPELFEAKSAVEWSERRLQNRRLDK